MLSALPRWTPGWAPMMSRFRWAQLWGQLACGGGTAHPRELPPAPGAALLPAEPLSPLTAHPLRPPAAPQDPGPTNGIIASVPGHPLWLEVLRLMQERWKEDPGRDVVEATGAVAAEAAVGRRLGAGRRRRRALLQRPHPGPPPLSPMRRLLCLLCLQAPAS